MQGHVELQASWHTGGGYITAAIRMTERAFDEAEELLQQESDETNAASHPCPLLIVTLLSLLCPHLTGPGHQESL